MFKQFEYPDFRKSGFPDSRQSGSPGCRKAGNFHIQNRCGHIYTNDQRFQTSENLDFRISDNPELQESDNSTYTDDQRFRISENPDFWISDNPVLRDSDNVIFHRIDVHTYKRTKIPIVWGVHASNSAICLAAFSIDSAAPSVAMTS